MTDHIPPGFKLLQATLLLRHGDRAPTSNIFSSPPSGVQNGMRAEAKARAETAYWFSQLPSPLTLQSLSSMFPIKFNASNPLAGEKKLEASAASAHYGLLTRQGLVGSYQIGERLRRIYVVENGLLPLDLTCSGDVVVTRSTAMKRTVQSAQSVLHGFCKPQGAKDKGSGSIFVEAEDDMEMPNFGFMSKKCPALVKQWQASMQSAHGRAVELETTPLIHSLESYYPMLKSTRMSHTSKMLKLFDHFKCHQAHELPTAPGTGPETMSTLKSWARDTFWRLYAAQHATQTTLLCTRILETMERRLENLQDSTVPRMCVFSGHDTTIMPMMATLMVVVPTPQEEWPPYSAHIRIELLEKELNHTPYVRVVYRDHAVLRSMEEFRALILSQRKDLKVECVVMEETEEKKSGGGGLNPFQDNR